MINTFLIIFLNKKEGSILNLIHKSLYRSCLQHFELPKKKKKINKGQSLVTNWFIASLLYVTINKIIHVYFSHMTYLISHVTSLNNTCGWSYKLLHSEL